MTDPDGAAGPFYHGTDAVLGAGDRIVPAAERGTRPAHPVTEGCWPSRDDRAYATEWRIDAGHWGRHVYRVRPVGALAADPNGSEGDWEVDGHLLVLATETLPARRTR